MGDYQPILPLDGENLWSVQPVEVADGDDGGLSIFDCIPYGRIVSSEGFGFSSEHR